MASKYEEDWSDSEDEEMGSDVETSVQLGIPDGPLESTSDILDAAVSRIGGHPVRYIPRLRVRCSSLIPNTSCVRAIGLPERARAAARVCALQ